MLADHYNEDDFIVVKLDIDTPSVEGPLAYQPLEEQCCAGVHIDLAINR